MRSINMSICVVCIMRFLHTQHPDQAIADLILSIRLKTSDSIRGQKDGEPALS